MPADTGLNVLDLTDNAKKTKTAPITTKTLNYAYALEETPQSNALDLNRITEKARLDLTTIYASKISDTRYRGDTQRIAPYMAAAGCFLECVLAEFVATYKREKPSSDTLNCPVTTANTQLSGFLKIIRRGPQTASATTQSSAIPLALLDKVMSAFSRPERKDEAHHAYNQDEKNYGSRNTYSILETREGLCSSLTPSFLSNAPTPIVFEAQQWFTALTNDDLAVGRAFADKETELSIIEDMDTVFTSHNLTLSPVAKRHIRMVLHELAAYIRAHIEKSIQHFQDIRAMHVSAPRSIWEALACLCVQSYGGETVLHDIDGVYALHKNPIDAFNTFWAINAFVPSAQENSDAARDFLYLCPLMNAHSLDVIERRAHHNIERPIIRRIEKLTLGQHTINTVLISLPQIEAKQSWNPDNSLHINATTEETLIQLDQAIALALGHACNVIVHCDKSSQPALHKIIRSYEKKVTVTNQSFETLAEKIDLCLCIGSHASLLMSALQTNLPVALFEQAADKNSYYDAAHDALALRCAIKEKNEHHSPQFFNAIAQEAFSKADDTTFACAFLNMEKPQTL